MKGMDKTKTIGAFLNNYFPHLFVNMDKLTDEDIAKIFGRLKHLSTKNRTIRGTLKEIKAMMDLPEGHPEKLSTHLELLGAKDAINVYVQGMSRTIIGRNALNSMLKLNLEIGDKAKPALLSLADLDVLKGNTIGIVGYGSQGHAHALNLKDNGQKVVVGLYPESRSRATAQEAGLEVADVPEVAKMSDVLMVLIPDHLQGDVYRQQIAPNLRPNSALMFAHGFSIHFGAVTPPNNVDVLMVAPKAPGHRMRELFTEGVGVPGLLAVHQDSTGNGKNVGLAYA